MLNFYPRRDRSPEPQHQGDDAAQTIWWDLLDGNDQERAAVERATGLEVPTLAQISEIESSSRLYTRGDALYLSAPVAFRNPAERAPATSSVGIVLSPRCMVTVRFAPLPAFDAFAAKFDTPAAPATGVEAFVGLLEVIADRLADALELIGSDLDRISEAIFHANENRPRRADQLLRETLRHVGRMGDHISKLRDSLLAFGRMVPFVTDNAGQWIPETLRGRFRTLRRDISSLRDYDEHMSNKVQFLLDASLGLISIQQSDIFKILTVVSVVGIPPTLVAGIYGMNFKNMPELGWAWGYEYGWALIIVSAVIPLVWCRLRGWI